MTDRDESTQSARWNEQGLRTSFARWFPAEHREALTTLLRLLYYQQLECGAPDWKGPPGAIRDLLAAVADDLRYCLDQLHQIARSHEQNALDDEDGALSLATKLRVSELERFVARVEGMVAWQPSAEQPLPPSDRV